MQKQQPTFHPISKASSFLEITGGMLKSAKEQLVNMENIQNQPHILDDELINRSVKLFTAQNKDLDLFLQQCSLWREKELTEIQQYQVTTIEENVNSLIKINNQILDIVDKCKNSTIDKILAKDDIELALDALSGKITLPK